jgi:hypothetical protein
MLTSLNCIPLPARERGLYRIALKEEKKDKVFKRTPTQIRLREL